MTRFNANYTGDDPIASGELRLDIAAGVARLTIAREADGNRLTPEILARLAVIARDLADHDDVQVLVLVGAGLDFFSRGIFDPALRARHCAHGQPCLRRHRSAAANRYCRAQRSYARWWRGAGAGRRHPARQLDRAHAIPGGRLGRISWCRWSRTVAGANRSCAGA